MNEPQSKSEHVLSLAADLLDDIELGRLSTEQLLLKVSRLARLTGSDETRKWLKYELHGYNEFGKIYDKYMEITGRWSNQKEKKGYFHSLAGIESVIENSKSELKIMRIPDISISSTNPRELAPSSIPLHVTNKIISNCDQLNYIIKTMVQIKGKVLSLLHKFVCDVYYERVFSGMVGDVFERYKAMVDSHLAGRCGDVLEKFPAVYDRLAEGDSEAVSQALTTCRRIIASFADSIFPASNTTIEINGNTVKLGDAEVKNRINAYIIERTSSDSRRDKLRQSLNNLWGRTSSGVHADVAQDEARSLLLNVYLLLGEIILLPESKNA